LQPFYNYPRIDYSIAVLFISLISLGIIMATAQHLAKRVDEARQAFLRQANLFSERTSKWKSSPDSWCATEIIEHLFWAEQGGVLGMWKSLYANREGKSFWEGEPLHKGLTIEEIITKTWKEKEIVPAVAAPRMSGPLAFWIISLDGLQQNLDALAKELTPDDLKIMTQPHPISGPLDMHQRFEFLRFHLNRHQQQLIDIYSQLTVQL
jgi:DinB family protein